MPVPALPIDVNYTIDLVESDGDTVKVEYTLSCEDPEYSKAYERWFRPEDLYQGYHPFASPAIDPEVQIKTNFLVLERATFEAFANYVRRLAHQEQVETSLGEGSGVITFSAHEDGNNLLRGQTGTIRFP